MAKLLLKISGEVLSNTSSVSLAPSICKRLAKSIARLVKQGHQIALVVGGGNFCRGVQADKLGVDRISVDYMGMLATLMNGTALKSFFEEEGLHVKLLTGLDCPEVAEKFTREKMRDYLLEDKVLFFVGGTGHPFFSTDTAAALRSGEMGVDFLLKATKVDGVYDSDPLKNASAKRFKKLKFADVIEKKLEVMDQAAFHLCQTNRIPIIVFTMDLLLSDDEISLEKIQQSGTVILC